MKKLIVYALLSVVLIVPIVSIVVITIQSIPENTITYNFTYDEGNIDLKSVQRGSIAEYIDCRGIFDNTNITYLSIPLKYNDSIISITDTGDNVKVGDVLCIKNSQEVLNENECVISNVFLFPTELVYELKGLEVDVLRFYLPIDTFEEIENSEVLFNIGDTRYEAVFKTKERAFNRENNGYLAEYEISGENLIVNAYCDLSIMSGRIKENALTVPKECVFKNKNGTYYIKSYEDGIEQKIDITLGIIGDQSVEIIGSGIRSGLPIMINTVNIFMSTSMGDAQTSSSNEDLLRIS